MPIMNAFAKKNATLGNATLRSVGMGLLKMGNSAAVAEHAQRRRALLSRLNTFQKILRLVCHVLSFQTLVKSLQQNSLSVLL